MTDLHYCARLLAAALCSLPLSTPALQAAPDNSFGMALLGAVINGDGTTARGSGVTGSSRASQGNYIVTFDRPLADCTFSAAPVFIAGGTTSVIVPRVIGLPSTSNIQFNVNRVSDGTLVDSPFSLVVFCPK
jgi:hypothetical protein